MISVIIPVYGSYDFITDCIDSVMNQTYFVDNKYEILVGVDGDQDTAEVVIDYAEDYKNIRVIVMDGNHGQYTTLNALIKEAQGDIIVRFNADDIMCEDMVEVGMDYIDTYDIVRFGCYSFLVKEEMVVSVNNFPRGEAMMFHKQFIVDMAGYKPWRTEGDRDLTARVRASLIKDVSESLYKKRLHPDSLFYSNEYGFHTEYSRGLREKIGLPKDGKMECGKYSVGKYGDYPDAIPISIVISAYNSEEFIEECLDSIEAQSYFSGNDNYEVIVGVDGCADTLKKVQEIRHKYRNLRVFSNIGNQGVYATINALMDAAKNDVILRFDADDVMKPNMIRRGMYYAKDYDLVQFGYDTFRTDPDKVTVDKFRCADGVVFVRKWLFDKAGGFRAWTCAADSEFIGRVRNNARVKRTRARLFHRRIHDNSLTRDLRTSYTSNKRRKYKDQIRIYKEGEDYKIDMLKAKTKEI